MLNKLVSSGLLAQTKRWMLPMKYLSKWWTEDGRGKTKEREKVGGIASEREAEKK